MKNLFKLSFILFAFVFASCGDDDDGAVITDGQQTISQFVGSNPDYSALGAALERANLLTVLNGDGPFTVFAPNNAAFASFLNANGFASLEDVPVDVLTNTLLNHVLPGTNNAASLTTTYVNSLATFGDTANNLSIYVDTTSGVVLNGVSTVTDADVPVSNGVIHAVDTVIAIPTIVTQATANPAFSTLVDALVAASDATTDYVALLSGTTGSPFTVFAPTNDAFAALLDSLGFASLDDVPQDILQTILNYHVVAGANVQSGNLENGQVVPTFQGENLIINLDGVVPQVVDATGMGANIIVLDVQTGNGVVHAINKVLLPQAVIDVVDPTISGLAMMTPDLSTLFQALQITGLDAVLDDRSAEFTVFAPTNESFDTFLGGASIETVPVDVLTQVLLNHVLSGTILEADLATGYANTLATFNGEADAPLSIYINIDAGVRLNDVSTVAAADITAANGVVHVVNGVIGLPTVVTFATADPTFSQLVEALTRADQPDFVTILSTDNGTAPAPFTVFAPTNQAFADLYTELGVGGINDIDGTVLTNTLLTHVVPEANVRAEDLVDGTVGTLGDDIIIDAANAIITDPNGRTSQIIVTNVQAANGVVHAIQTVLLPQL